MAKLKTIKWSGSDLRIMNVDAAVGARGGVNLKEDVMVVQALFKYLHSKYRGVPDSECPQPTGVFDKATAGLISKFQAYYHRILVQDGIIHSARDNNYQWGSRKYWTIALLNNLALHTALLNGETNFIASIFDRYPSLEESLDPIKALMKMNDDKIPFPNYHPNYKINFF